jgi:hypothetical protein
VRIRTVRLRHLASYWWKRAWEMRLQSAFGFGFLGHFLSVLVLSWPFGLHFFDPNGRGDYLMTFGGIVFGFCFVFRETRHTVDEDAPRVKLWLTTPQ